MHDCPFCGRTCDCDGEDTWFSFYPDCTCQCDDLDQDDEDNWDTWDDDEYDYDPSVNMVCRECGCTDERACPGGCWWVEPDLCSQCARKLEMKQKGWLVYLAWRVEIWWEGWVPWWLEVPVGRCNTCGKIDRVLRWGIGKHDWCVPF